MYFHGRCQLVRLTAKLAILLAILNTCSAQTAAAQFSSDLWENWSLVRVSPSDPYQLRHQDIVVALDDLVSESSGRLRLEPVGLSAEGREIKLARWGQGPLRILLWSQMHGDEPTATASLLDVMSYLNSEAGKEVASLLESRVELLMIPMLNPDGAERTRRWNAQGIDINRDALSLITPEGRILKRVRDELQPQVGFNLHNQSPLVSVGETLRPVVISLLAVPFDREGNDNPGRVRSKKICARIYETLGPYCYGRIARYEDSFNVRAFGDQLTAWGTPTILIESGFPESGEEQLVRLNFVALLDVMVGLADGSAENANPAVYDSLLPNQRGLRFDWIIRGATIVSGNGIPPFSGDVGVNFRTSYDRSKQSHKRGVVAELGDLSPFGAERVSDGRDWLLSPSDLSKGPVSGEILPGSEDLFIFRSMSSGTVSHKSNLEKIGEMKGGVVSLDPDD